MSDLHRRLACYPTFGGGGKISLLFKFKHKKKKYFITTPKAIDNYYDSRNQSKFQYLSSQTGIKDAVSDNSLGQVLRGVVLWE